MSRKENLELLLQQATAALKDYKDPGTKAIVPRPISGSIYTGVFLCWYADHHNYTLLREVVSELTYALWAADALLYPGGTLLSLSSDKFDRRPRIEALKLIIKATKELLKDTVHFNATGA